jgi:hypothetical protein
MELVSRLHLDLLLLLLLLLLSLYQLMQSLVERYAQLLPSAYGHRLSCMDKLGSYLQQLLYPVLLVSAASVSWQA